MHARDQFKKLGTILGLVPKWERLFPLNIFKISKIIKLVPQYWTRVLLNLKKLHNTEEPCLIPAKKINVVL